MASSKVASLKDAFETKVDISRSATFSGLKEAYETKSHHGHHATPTPKGRSATVGVGFELTRSAPIITLPIAKSPSTIQASTYSPSPSSSSPRLPTYSECTDDLTKVKHQKLRSGSRCPKLKSGCGSRCPKYKSAKLCPKLSSQEHGENPILQRQKTGDGIKEFLRKDECNNYFNIFQKIFVVLHIFPRPQCVTSYRTNQMHRFL